MATAAKVQKAETPGETTLESAHRINTFCRELARAMGAAACGILDRSILKTAQTAKLDKMDSMICVMTVTIRPVFDLTALSLDMLTKK
ncbi:hypothetical protein HYQ46_005853 [Verticillium longisporum]|nr:hypothetical protein HYQ46_005853 [Verticillium longisporum]